MAMKKATGSLFNMGKSPLNKGKGIFSFLKATEEGKLRRSIKKGLRNNESVDVSSDGVVTGTGGDRVKGSGKGRRKVARILAEDLTEKTNTINAPGGGATNDYTNVNIRANKNLKKNKQTIEGPTATSTTGSMRVNSKGTKIYTTNTESSQNIQKSKLKNNQRASANYDYSRPDTEETTTTAYQPGTITTKPFETTETSTLNEDGTIKSSTDLSGARENESLRQAYENMAADEYAMKNKGGGPNMRSSAFKMKGSPFNDKPHTTTKDHAAHGESSRTESTVTGGTSQNPNTSVIGTNVNKYAWQGQKTTAFDPSDPSEKNNPKQNACADPGSAACAKWKKSQEDTSYDVNTTSTGKDSTYNKGIAGGTNTVVTPQANDSGSIGGTPTIKNIQKDDSSKKVERVRMSKEEKKIIRVNNRENNRNLRNKKKQDSNASRGKCPPCNC